MAAEYSSTDAFRGATFRGVDLTGATFRDCILAGVRITGSDIGDLRVSGYAPNGGGVVVDGVDVTAFVRLELDRRHPERVRLRDARTPEDLRAVWAIVERLWDETLLRAEQLPEAVRRERVDDEWSVVETLRHLVMATDIWLGRMIELEERPFHEAGLPPTEYPEDGLPELGIDPTAQPSYEEAVSMHAERREQVRAFLEAVTDAELRDVRTAVPLPAWGERSHSVRDCLGVLVDEYIEHRRFAARDLAALELRA
jgi:uncharacterized damage-inducible protein DinB